MKFEYYSFSSLSILNSQFLKNLPFVPSLLRRGKGREELNKNKAPPPLCPLLAKAYHYP